jgi:hypothetical protein
MADFNAQTTPSLPHETGRTAAQLIDENDGLGVGTRYVNRVFDAVAADFVRWTTADAADITGASYPGPDAFGSTTDFCAESKL